jgi:large subunit ribosomal protein L29
MRAYEIRNLTDSDIITKMAELDEELFNLRFQKSIGQAKDPNRFNALKKDVARMKTVLNERRLSAKSD